MCIRDRINTDQITYFADFMSDDALVISKHNNNYYDGIAAFASHRQCIGTYAYGGVFDHDTENFLHPEATTWAKLMPLLQYYDPTPPTNQWCDIAGEGGPGTSVEGYAHMHMSGYFQNKNALARKQRTSVDQTGLNATLAAGGRASLAAYTTELMTALNDGGDICFLRIPIVARIDL